MLSIVLVLQEWASVKFADLSMYFIRFGVVSEVTWSYRSASSTRRMVFTWIPRSIPEII